jgi:hypothetical protein
MRVAVYLNIGVTATYEVIITVTNTEHFGELVDKILALDGFIISKIEWQPDEVPFSLFDRKKQRMSSSPKV